MFKKKAVQEGGGYTSNPGPPGANKSIKSISKAKSWTRLVP